MFPRSTNSVIVPVDFSERSLAAVKAAAVIAASVDQIHVVCVLPRLEVNDPGVIWNTVDDDARREHALESLQNAFAAPDFQGLTFEIRFGDAGKQIVEYAREKKSDLIVMPSHGRSGLQRILLGSVADRVVRLAPCPVLILRPE